LLILVFLLTVSSALARAASIRGVVTDTTGGRVKGATVGLLNNGKVIADAVSGEDGSFEVLTGVAGRFYIVVSAKSFRQLETPVFYAGQLDAVERNVNYRCCVERQELAEQQAADKGYAKRPAQL